MFMRKELIIFIIISILMAKIKTSKGRIYEGKHKNQRELNKLNFHGLQTRHYNHYLHKKHVKCSLERSYYRQAHVKKSSRYPTLDKIVHRLDNQIDHLDKIKLATANPFDEWNVTSPPSTTFSGKSDLYAYVTVGLKKGNPAKDEHDAGEGRSDPEHVSIREDFDATSNQGNMNIISDIVTEGSASNRGFMQDHTTSSPWVRVQHLTIAVALLSCADPVGSRLYVVQQPISLSSSSSGAPIMPFKISSAGVRSSSFSSSSSLFYTENEQHDINSHVEGSSKTPSEGLSTLSTLPSQTPTNADDEKKDLILDKVPFWSIGQLAPRLGESDDRKKKTTPMPYVAAHAHYDQILRMGDCHIPKEKVIKVHEVHPDPSKSYSPSCTILHQCGDDTGCCRDLKQVCKPKNTTKVELYFFTTTVGKPQTVEKLHFVNHTECECQKRTEEPLPRDSEFRRNHQKKHGHGITGDIKRKRNNCTCPSKYSARFLSNESCICDCFDKQDDCLVLKKGKSHFSYQDKLCIQSGVCLVPSCEFGSYIRQFGRCPNKSEKYHYRWSRILSYRDLIT